MKKLLLLFCLFTGNHLVNAQIFWPTDVPETIATLGLYSLSGITSADLNNDGTDEIIFSSAYSTTRKISIYNPADGTTLEIGTSVNGASFAFGDFNEDGYLDIVYRAGSATVYLSDDTKPFLSYGFYVGTQLTNSASSMAVGDYNNDNNLDIIVAYASPHKWTTLAGDGLGGFTETYLGLPASWSATSTFTNSIELLDFNGDSNLDIVASGRSQGTPAKYGITISLGDGAGGFTLASDYFTTQDDYANGPEYYSDDPLITDADGDGKMDLIFNDDPANQAKILHNNGVNAPGFSSLGYGIGSYYGLIDYDGDLKEDLIVMTRNGHYDIKLADGAGNFTYDRSLATTTYQGYRFTTADADGDGNRDIVYYDGIEKKIYMATYDFGYKGYKGLVNEYKLRNETHKDAVLADLDFGGYDDLLTIFNDSLAVMMNKENQWAFDSITYYPTPPNPEAIEVIDIQGDGKPEVIVGSADPANTNITIFANDGSGVLSQSSQITAANVKDMAAGDLNGDNKPDLLVLTTSDILVLLNNGSGGFAAPVGYAFPNAHNIEAGDMNGDGFTDVIIRRGERVYLHQGDGTGMITIGTDYTRLGSYSNLLVGDFNNDGLADAAGIAYVSNQLDDNLNLVLGQSGKLISELPIATFFAYRIPRSMKLADLNGDGNQDIIITANRAKEIKLLFGDGTGSFSDPMPAIKIASDDDNTGAHIAVGEINSDNKQDVVLVRLDRAHPLLNVYAQASEPIVHASNIVIGTPDFNGTNISWVRGSGNNVMVLLAEAALDMTKLPVDYAVAQDLGINTIIYDGTGTSAGSGFLKKNTTYQVGVIEYNGSTISANYFTSGFPTASFTTPKGTQIITYNYSADVPFTNTALAGTATVNSGLPITYEVVSGPAVITTEGEIKLTGIGAVTIRATQAGNNEWDAATPVEQTFNVIQGSQSIVFTLAATTFIGYDNYQLPIYSTEGLPISYSLDSGIGSLTTSGDTTWYVWAGEGSVTITASQAGSTEFTAAVPVTRSTTISKQDQTITWSRSYVYKNRNNVFTYLNGESIQMTLDTLQLAAVSSSGLPVTYIITAGPGYLLGIGQESSKYIYNGVGTVTISAAAQGDNVYNSSVPSDVTFTIIKGFQTISYNAQIAGNPLSDYPYNPDTWVKINPVATSGLPVTLARYNGVDATIAGDSVNVTTAGNFTLALSQPGDANWDAATTVYQGWKVNKATQTITFDDIYNDMVVKDSVMILNATNDSGEAILYQITRNPSNASVSVSGNEFTMSSTSRSGAITISAYSQASTNYEQSAVVLVDFCLLPATPTLTATGLETSLVYLESSNTIDYTEWEKNTVAWGQANGSSQVQVLEEGVYRIRSRSIDGECPASDWSNEVSILITQLDEELAAPSFYPNPVQTKLTVALGPAVNIATGVEVTLAGIDGKVVYHQYIDSLPDRKLEIDMTGYEDGIYLIQIINEGKVVQYKIKKQ